MHNERWVHQPAFWLELFILANISFLAFDIYVAHSINAFAERIEWLPIFFSAVATLVLLLAFPKSPVQLTAGWRRMAGLAVGFTSIALGIAGMIFHLESQFFAALSIKSLVYTAPFIAPLAYTGVGFLIVLNRMVPIHTLEWEDWALLFATGGVVGNFILALCDHAQNGFFRWDEWIPVYCSAMVTGLLIANLASPDKANKPFLTICLLGLALQAGVGLLGFYYHGAANLAAEAGGLRDRFLYGAPLFAPLLLPNISLLALIAFWSQARRLNTQDRKLKPLVARPR